ncbi:oxygenase MpaB family protein [Brevibacillus dissolubilis]|uniref:oxygenase MpaB family protein n=1 Tax=Brevibacillus dissolubilis TaxID=1844116 RepID=UPI0011166C80|nr:oxygenase MpaB family protein [Brevibacillus dissolubilis]
MRYSDAYLDSLRLEGDPKPDHIIEELLAHGKYDVVHQILKELVKPEGCEIESFPPVVQAFLHSQELVPPHIDKQRLMRASQFFVENVLGVYMILVTASLIESYAVKIGVKVLQHSSRLTRDVEQRILETARFGILIMAPDRLFADGIMAIQKIRLIHAAARYMVLHRSKWPVEQYGVPICQEDLLCTLLAFSYTVVQKLRILGARINKQDAEDYMYLWQVAGEMMGIRPDAIPVNMQEARHLYQKIRERQFGPSAEGEELTQVLLGAMPNLFLGGFMGRLIGKVIIPVFLPHMVGREMAEWLRIPTNSREYLYRPLKYGLRMLDRSRRKSPSVRNLTRGIGIFLVNSFMRSVNGEGLALFSVQTHSTFELEHYDSPQPPHIFEPYPAIEPHYSSDLNHPLDLTHATDEQQSMGA